MAFFSFILAKNPLKCFKKQLSKNIYHICFLRFTNNSLKIKMINLFMVVYIFYSFLLNKVL